MSGARRRWPPLPARLFWRVYLNGLLLLALVALALVGVSAALGHRPQARHERFAELAAALAGDVWDDPARLGRQLARAREAFGVAATAYAGDRPIASSVEPPLPPPGAAERARLAAGALRLPGRHFAFAAQVEGRPGAYVVLAGRMPSDALLRGASVLIAVLLALALASIPLARAIAAPLERLGRAVRAFGAGDLSARAGLRAPGEVGEVAAAFDLMAGRIEALLRTERELLANVSHELRTPMARIRVALELAAEGDAERARRYLDEIGADLQELDRLVEDVLTTARLDLGAPGDGPGLALRLERVDPGELVRRAAERFREAHPARRLELALGDGLPSLEADPALLRRVLDNLLDNARKYSDAETTITLAARAEGGGVAVEVLDRGIGFDAADLPRLFTPFFRSDRSRARGTGGTGLGLALSKRVVEAHGGSIAAESAPGQGTRIRFSVPGARAS